MDCQNGEGIRFLRKTQNEGERKLIASWWEELTQMYGTYVDYFVYGYSLTGHDFLYGEEPTASFEPPQGMSILVDISNDSLLLSKFGIESLAEFTAIIPIKTFKETFGDAEEPKAGDLIRMTELGWDRPGTPNDINTTDAPLLSDICELPIEGVTDSQAYSGYNEIGEWLRGAPVYEITERRDDAIPMGINALQGHYVWLIYGKRFDYSYQPGIDPEPGSDQVYDDTFAGRLSGGFNPESDGKLYDQNTTDESNTIFDYDEHPGSDDDVYGEY